jgi:hypothetical protein
MEEEEPEGPLLLISGATPLGDQPGDMVVTELSVMKAVRALIRQLVPTGLCPPPPVVSRPRSTALFGVLDEPEAPAFERLGQTPPPRPSPRIRLAVSWTLPYGMRNARESDTSAPWSRRYRHRGLAASSR